jgi:hypothetical protein
MELTSVAEAAARMVRADQKKRRKEEKKKVKENITREQYLHEVSFMGDLKLLLQLVNCALKCYLHNVEVFSILVLYVLTRRFELLQCKHTEMHDRKKLVLYRPKPDF